MIPTQKILRRRQKEDELHIAVLTGRLKKVKELLRKGVHIESVNSDGQTPLFCASFGGDYEVVSLLLTLGANPNRKCGKAAASPVHAAAFRGSRRVLRILVEYGGDLFSRDVEYLLPRDYALKQQAPLRQQKILQFIDFLESMTVDSGMPLTPAPSSSTLLSESGGTLKLKGIFSSQLSLSRGSSQSTTNLLNTCIREQKPHNPVHLTPNLHQNLSCHLLNTLCVTTSLPLLSPTQLKRPTDPSTAYTCGGPTVYSQYTWLGTPVTVRKPTPLLSMNKSENLAIDGIPPDPEAIRYLLQELSLLKRLRHPAFLEVMAACHVTSFSPDHVTLVYQHVPYGSLHHHLHVQHRDLLASSAVEMIIGIVEGLMFMHAHGWLHCGLSSHAVHMINLSSAKLGSFEHSVESQAKGCGMRAEHLSKASWLRPWQAPETIVENMVSIRSEIYGISVIMWEMWSGMPPWSGVEDADVASRIANGETLPELKEVPSLLSYITQYGLKWNEHEREIDLEEMHTLLKSLKIKCKDDERVPAISCWGPPSIPNTPVCGRSKAVEGDSMGESSSKDSQSDIRYAKWDEITAIKPASHQIIRHSSSCSLASVPLVRPEKKLVPENPSKTLKEEVKRTSETSRPRYRKTKRRNIIETNDDFIDDEFDASLFDQPHMQLFAASSSDNLMEQSELASSIDFGSQSASSSSSNEESKEKDEKDKEPDFAKEKNLLFKNISKNDNLSSEDESELFLPLKSPKNCRSLKSSLEKNVKAYLPRYHFDTDTDSG